MEPSIKAVTTKAPINIAVIKYWGKTDENLILPLNDSLSGTLCTDQMCAKTTVAFSPNFQSDRMWLNGKEESFDNKRLQNCLKEIKKRAKSLGKLTDNELEHHVHVASVNNFPTAAGLASSAAGYACLVYALSKLYEIEGDISSIARQGSGSACRSVYGGFVEWITGQQKDGGDSIARQIVDANHWPQMRVLILVVNDREKKTGSTLGMQTSVQTSELLKHRISHCVPQRQADIIQAIKNRDFETFAKITMQDSNQLHAVCLDTYPPLVYMNDISHAIADLVHAVNQDHGRNIVAYTFDAGPNACLYLLEEYVPVVLAAINSVFPTKKSTNEYYKGIPISVDYSLTKNLASLSKRDPWNDDALRYIIHTKVGDGPTVCSPGEHLLDDQGLPKL